MADSYKISADDAGRRVDRWFKEQYKSAPYSLFAKLQRKRKIKVNRARVDGAYILQTGDEVVIYNEMKVEEVRAESGQVARVGAAALEEFKKLIIFENANFFVINKPQGLPSQGGSGIKISVDDYIHALSPRYKLVHRLDRDTSGCLAIAKKTMAATAFSEALQTGEIKKKYIAVVAGVPQQKQGFIEFALLKKGAKQERMEIDEAGKEAKTEYRLLKKFGTPEEPASVVELEPHTGRTHQLRVHMAAIDCPIMGDGKYGGQNAFYAGFAKKLHLHARLLQVPALGIDAIAAYPEHIERWVK